MANIIPLKDNTGAQFYPQTHEKAVVDSNGVNLQTKLASITTPTYVTAWDGASTPVVANIPAGVTVTYNTTSYTGTLAASASTANKTYLVSTGTTDNYNRYVTQLNGSTYSWQNIGSTEIDLNDYATKEELGQLDQIINVEANERTIANGATLSKYINYTNGVATNSTTNKATDYIDISSYRGKTIKYLQNVYTSSTGSVGMAFYDSNKAFLSGLPCHFGGSAEGVEETSTTIPNAASYARFTIFNTSAESFYVKCVVEDSSRILEIENELSVLQGEVNSITPIIINGNVTNAPDEEDITSDSNNLLKFKDRLAGVGKLGYKILRDSATFAEQVTSTDTIYEIRYAFDLDGVSINIPAGCVLYFNGGELTNGSIVANSTIITGDYDGHIKVSILGTNATPDFRISHVSDAIDTSKFASARNGVVVVDNVNINTNVDLYCDVRGLSRNVSITVAGACNYGFHVVSPNVTISNITIEKRMPASGTAHAHLYREAIQGIESNLSVINCTIKGGISLYNTDTQKVVTGCFIKDCDIIADFTNIPDNQSTMIKDVLFFYGCSNIWVEDNNVIATNVLRIIKSSALATSQDYSTYVQNPDNIHICRNKFVANSTLGKQFFDMYCGTRNVFVKDNYIFMRGHSCVFEDKTIASDNTKKYHVIEGNIIDIDSQVCFASMSTNDTFAFFSNKIKVTDYSQLTAPFNIKGCDFIFNQNRLEFVGTYTYVTMTFGVSDSENAPINRADVSGNIFVNTRRLQPEHLLYLNYTDNDVNPQEQEIDINTTRALVINFRKRIFRATGKPLFYNQQADASNVKIYLDAYNLDQMVSRCSTNTDAAKTKFLSAIITDDPVYATPSSNAQYYLKDTYSSMAALDGTLYTSGMFRVRFTDIDYAVTHTSAGWRADDGQPTKLRKGTTVQREALTLTSADAGLEFYDETLGKKVLYNGTAWVNVDGSALS